MIRFILESVLLGAGLAMDAFSVSLANGLNEPGMKKKKEIGIAAVFAGFQFVMPLLGWLLVRTLMDVFSFLEKLIPWIALVLLLAIGGKMIYEGLKKAPGEADAVRTGGLIIQGIATSIDALSVGLAIATYSFPKALACAAIILAVTFGICYAGVNLGKRFGTIFAGKASVFGGVILILIGIEIFISGVM